MRDYTEAFAKFGGVKSLANCDKKPRGFSADHFPLAFRELMSGWQVVCTPMQHLGVVTDCLT